MTKYAFDEFKFGNLVVAYNNIFSIFLEKYFLGLWLSILYAIIDFIANFFLSNIYYIICGYIYENIYWKHFLTSMDLFKCGGVFTCGIYFLDPNYDETKKKIRTLETIVPSK